MLDAFHFPDICVDMLAAHVFVRPEPFQIPVQPQVAFWRALRMLATVDWNTQMIILNFNEDLTSEYTFLMKTTSLNPVMIDFWGNLFICVHKMTTLYDNTQFIVKVPLIN